ncbi:MAG: bifunctional DNA-formamidopyrimidine glycosylase/DNA-(apurinic or apyrimidinic site) lyase [Pseudomonadota bacterium]
MPELPEVETVRRGLEPVMTGARILSADVRRPDLRFPFPEKFSERLAGQTIISLGRRSKYLTMDLANGAVVIMHLGMSGRFLIEERHSGEGARSDVGDFVHDTGRLPQHDHVVLHLERDGGQMRVIYNDPRRFGFMLMTERARFDEHPLIKDLGVEPIGNALSPDYLASRFLGKAAPLKAALLDQKIIAGLGNIYVAESLWRAKLSPRRAAKTLVKKSGAPTARLEALTGHIVDVIQDAIAAGGSSLRDYTHTDGSLGYFQHAFAVYGREYEPCQRQGCRGVIARIVQSNRSSFYCPVCQR